MKLHTRVGNRIGRGRAMGGHRSPFKVLSLGAPSADAWCWFHEPRAIETDEGNGKLWFGTNGSDDNSVLTGRATLYEIDAGTGEKRHVVLARGTTTGTWADDHDYPVVAIRPDGRLIVFYCPHRTGGAILYRISVSPFTIVDGWSQEYSLGNGADYPTYPSPVILSGESDRLYLFYRNGLTGGPLSYITSDDIANVTPASVDGGALGATPTWTSEKQLATSAGTQGIYHKVNSNNDDRIDILATDAVGAQAQTKNDVRHIYWRAGNWHGTDGTILGDGSVSLGFSNFTAVATSGAPDNFGDMWVHDVKYRSDDLIEGVFWRFLSTLDHRCYYARWDGTSWSKRELLFSSSTRMTDQLGFGEGYYSPGAYLDDGSDGSVFVSIGTPYLSQLYQYITNDAGITWERRQVSSGGPENVRPVVPKNANNYIVLWLAGEYHNFDFTTDPNAVGAGYTTQVKAIQTFPQTDRILLYPTNLLTHTDSFDLWTVTAATVKLNMSGNPDDKPVADRFTETAVTLNHKLDSNTIAFTAGQFYTFSVRAKYESAQYVQLLFGSAAFGVNAYANFDIQNGVVGTVGSQVSKTWVIDEGNGWYRIGITCAATATASTSVAIFGANASTMGRAFSYAGSTANKRLFSSAQIEVGRDLNRYMTNDTPSDIVYALDGGFEVADTGTEDGINYVDLRITASPAKVIWSSYGGLACVTNDVMRLMTYAVKQSGSIGFSSLYAMELASNGDFLNSVDTGVPVFESGTIKDCFVSTDATLLEATLAKGHGAWYIEGDVGTVIRFSFAPPVIV